MVPFFRAVRAEKRGREATPFPGGEAPSPGGKAPPILGGRSLPPLLWARLRSLVFWGRVVLNVGGFGRNLVGMVFGTSPKDCQADFVIFRQGAEIGVLAIFVDFKAI